jgi:lysophospholipase
MKASDAHDAARNRISGGAPLHRVPDGPPLPEGKAEWLAARSGRRLRVASFPPAGTARGSVVLSTGRTEQIEKYGEVIGELVNRGFAVVAHDWAGQGLSTRFPGDPMRGDLIGGASAFISDFGDILDAFEDELPRPWVALAHSMGAALTALALVEGESRFSAACLCAPMVQFSVGKLPFAVIRTVVAVAGRSGKHTDLARKQVDPAEVKFEDNLLTHDRARYERTRVLYRAHPELRLGEPTWRWLDFAVDLRDRLLASGAPERVTCPVACVAAGDDRIVNTRAIAEFAARLPQGSYRSVPGAYHELLMERDEVRAELWRVFDELVARTPA